MSEGNGSRKEESWQPARLIPVAGIRGQEEQERRATSALLAVMGAVSEFGHALLSGLGAPKGRISTFAEIQLKDGEGKVSIPDGAIVVERGNTHWRALVEVKTGSAVLQVDQVSRYLDLARAQGFDAVVTISNQITARPTDSPVAIDKRRLKKVGFYHLSWWRVITEAVLQHRFRGVSDPEQAWILGELIAYLDHENSGASGFQDMGESWVRVRDGARAGTLRVPDKEVRAVAERWEQFVDYLALGLSQDLGHDVEPVRSRKQTLAERLEALVEGLAASGSMTGGVRVPGAIAPLSIHADLKARQLTTGVTVDAPREGRPTARINWVLRQLSGAPADLRITVGFANVRETTSLLLSEAREYPQRLRSPTDPKREPRTFELAMTQPLGLKSGKGQGSFVRETRRQVIVFYGEIVQNLKPWHARAPKLPEPPAEVAETPQPEPPQFAAVEERDVGEATTPTEPPFEHTPEQPGLDAWHRGAS
ncbi:MAG: hypothetical protein WD689_02900 [Gaiellaceae bacterium]